MSGQLVGWVLDHATVHGAQMLVLIDLAERAQNESSEVFAGVQRIALRTNLSEKSVTDSLSALQKGGWIENTGVTSTGTRRWRISVSDDIPKKLTRAEIQAAARAAQSPPEDSSPGEAGSPGEVSSPGESSSEPPEVASEPPEVASPEPSLTGREPEQPLFVSAVRADAKDLAERKEREKATAQDRRLCRLLAESIRARNPKAKIKNDAAWLKSIRLMRERDGHSVEEVEQLIVWLFSDPGRDATFWADTVQSMSGLREHFGQIWPRMHRQTSTASGNVVDFSKYDRAAGLL